METVLLYGRDLLCRMLDEVQAGIMLIDADSHKVTYANRAALVTIGRPKEEVIGSVCHQFICPVDVGKCPITDLRQTVDNVECVLINGRGERVPILKTVVSTVIEGRNYLVESFWGIAGRKQAEEALRKSHEQFRLSLEASRDAITINVGTKLVYANKSYAELLGFNDPSELIGHDTLEFIAPEYRELVRDRILRRMRGENLVGLYESIILRKDGVRVPVETHAVAIEWEGKQAILAFRRDITERKEEAEKLRRSEQQYRELLENSMEAISINVGTKLVYANRRYAELLGFNDPAELVGRDIMQFVASEYREKLKTRILTRERGEEMPRLFEMEIRRRDGTMIPVESHVTSIEYQGKKAGLIFRRDITERKRTEEAVSRLAAIVEGSNDAIIGRTADGIVTSWNKAAEKIFGYTAEEMIGKTLSCIVADGYDDLKEQLERIKKGEVEHYETKRVRKDGKIIDVSLTVSPIKDETGRVVGISGIVRDITERKRAETDLRESEERYRTLFDNANDALFFIDGEGRFLDVNGVACEQLGYSHEELRKMSLKDINLPEKAASIQQQIQTIREHVQVVFESRHVGRDGSSFPVEISARAITYKGKPALLGIARDISDRKRMQQARSRLAAIVEGSGDAILGTGVDGVIASWNRGAEALFGYSEKEAVGRHISLLLPPDQTDDGMKQILEKARRGESVHGLEVKRRRKDGAIIDVSLTVSPIRDDQGRPIGTSAIVRDISERRRMEEALQKSQEQYKTLVEASRDGISVTAGTKWVYVNQRYAEQMGFSDPSELVGRNLLESIAPEDRERVKNRIIKMEAGEDVPPLYEIMILRKDGTKVPAEINSTPINFEGKKAILAFRRDITERNRMEEKLRENEERYRSLFQNTREAIIMNTPDGRFTDFNQAWLDLLGYSREEMLKLNITQLYADPADRPKLLQKVVEDGYVRDFEIRFRRKDGELRYFLDTVVPWRNREGRILAYQGIARDITDRKRLEEELKKHSEHLEELVHERTMMLSKSEERYRTVLEGSVDAVAVIMDGFKLAYANKRYAEMLGFSDPSELIGRNPLDFILPEDREKIRKIGLALSRGELASSLHEVRVQRNDGTILIVEDHTTPIEYEGKKARLSFRRDITERKKLEDAAHRLAEELTALDATVLGITETTDLPGTLRTILERAMNLLRVNAGGLYLTDPERQEVHRVVSNMPIESTNTVLKYGEGAAGTVAKTGQPLIISDYHTWCGRAAAYEHIPQYHAFLSVPLIWQGKVTGVINVVSDKKGRSFNQDDVALLSRFANHAAIVVERKRVEEALRMSEVRFRELADLLPQMVFETDEKGILTFFNRVGLLLTGYTDEEINGGFDVFQLFPPEDAERAIESMRRVLGGDQTGPREYDLLKKDGSRFPVLLYSSPIIRNGKPVGLRGIILDMTEQKLMEEKLLRSKHLAAIGEAAAMVGHDLRNPLQGMTGAVYILKTERHLSEDGKAMLALIEEDIQRSDKIVSDLLDYSRELHLDLSTSNPKSLMEQSLASLKIPENIRIVDHTDEQPTVEMDVEKLSRVCVNLLKNACDAMPKGGTLTITSTESDDTVWLSFADNGEGMSEETLSKIWRPLFTTKARGMGYGLAVVKRFVEAHEGTVKVESKLGRGSTFTISLPIKQKTTSN